MAIYLSNITPIGVKLGQNAFRTIPDILFFEAENVKFLRTLNGLFYPPTIAPIGVKLGQNAFQTIPNISSFDPEAIFFLICGRTYDHMII